MLPSFLPSRNSVIGGLSVLSVAATGCSAPEESPKPHVKVVSDTESSSHHEDHVRSVNGTYGPSCGDRSGSYWSLPVGESDAALDHPLLTMIPKDTGCALALTDIVATGALNEEMLLNPRFARPIPLSDSWAQERSNIAMDGSMVYGNAMLETSADGNPVLSLLLSDHETGTEGAAQVHHVDSPDYQLRLGETSDADAVDLSVDAHQIVTSVTGSATLLEGAHRGNHYVIDLGTLPHSDAPLSPEVLARAYDAGEAYEIDGRNPKIPAERFGLIGQDVSSGLTRTVIIAHEENGVRSFEAIDVTFRVSG